MTMTITLDDRTLTRIALVQAVLRTCGRAVACAEFRLPLPCFELSMIDSELRDLQAAVERLGTELSVQSWQAYVSRTPRVDALATPEATPITSYTALVQQADHVRCRTPGQVPNAAVRGLTLQQFEALHHTHKTWAGVATALSTKLHVVENAVAKLRGTQRRWRGPRSA